MLSRGPEHRGQSLVQSQITGMQLRQFFVDGNGILRPTAFPEGFCQQTAGFQVIRPLSDRFVEEQVGLLGITLFFCVSCLLAK